MATTRKNHPKGQFFENSSQVCSKCPKVHDGPLYLPRPLASITGDTITGRYYLPVPNLCIWLLHLHILRNADTWWWQSQAPVIGNYLPQNQFPDHMKLRDLTRTLINHFYGNMWTKHMLKIQFLISVIKKTDHYFGHTIKWNISFLVYHFICSRGTAL